VILDATSFRQEGVAPMTFRQITQTERYLISAASALRRGIREIASDRIVHLAPSAGSYGATQKHGTAIGVPRKRTATQWYDGAVAAAVPSSAPQCCAPQTVPLGNDGARSRSLASSGVRGGSPPATRRATAASGVTRAVAALSTKNRPKTGVRKPGSKYSSPESLETVL